MRKLPEASVATVATVAPAASVSTTCAPGIIAPEGSATVPETAGCAAGAAAEDEAGGVFSARTKGQSRRADRAAIRIKAYLSRQRKSPGGKRSPKRWNRFHCALKSLYLSAQRIRHRDRHRQFQKQQR